MTNHTMKYQAYDNIYLNLKVMIINSKDHNIGKHFLSIFSSPTKPYWLDKLFSSVDESYNTNLASI